MISRIVFVSTIIVSTIFIMFNACEQKPSEPNYNNVFDPDNEQTEGDPFQLTASIANGGVTLTWNLVDIENLSNFKVYRSEN